MIRRKNHTLICLFDPVGNVVGVESEGCGAERRAPMLRALSCSFTLITIKISITLAYPSVRLSACTSSGDHEVRNTDG